MSEPIRILQVMGRLDLGGAETMMMSLYRAIDRNKVQLDFVQHTTQRVVFEDEIAQMGGRIFSCPQYTGKNHFLYCKWWDEFFKAHPEYRVIHGHVRSTAAIYLSIAKKHGLITIAHSHSTSNGRGLSSVVKYLMQFPIRYTADYLFSCSDKAGKWLFGNKAVQQPNYYMIPNGVDLDRFSFDANKRIQMRNLLGITESEFVIGHIGRLTTPKNHKYLVEIFAEYHQNNPKSRLLIVGGGELFDTIKTQCENAGIISSVLMLGSRTDTENYYQVMDAFVFPSLWEGLPVSVVEAQENGLACLLSEAITRDVCLTDLVTYISLADKKAWLDALNKAQSRGHHAVSVENGEKLQRFSSKWVAAKLESFYLEKDNELRK